MNELQSFDKLIKVHLILQNSYWITYCGYLSFFEPFARALRFTISRSLKDSTTSRVKKFRSSLSCHFDMPNFSFLKKRRKLYCTYVLQFTFQNLAWQAQKLPIFKRKKYFSQPSNILMKSRKLCPLISIIFIMLVYVTCLRNNLSGDVRWLLL